MQTNTGVAARYMLSEHVPNMYPNMYFKLKVLLSRGRRKNGGVRYNSGTCLANMYLTGTSLYTRVSDVLGTSYMFADL